MKRKFRFNIWNFMDINDVSDILSDITEKEGYIATNVEYLTITKKGVVTGVADYIPEED